MSKRDQFEIIKPRNLPKIGATKHKVSGSKLKLMRQPPQEVYRKLHPRMYGCFRFMCVAEYLLSRAGGANYGTRWATVAPIYDQFVLIFDWQVNETASAKRSCRNKPDVFCYMCGEYTIAPNRKPVTSFITRAYHAYFGIKLADQDKACAPHMVCKECTETLCGWMLYRNYTLSDSF